MAQPVLLGDNAFPGTQKALCAAQIVGVQVKTPKFDVNSAEFKEASPLGRAPVLTTTDGHSIIGGDAIARHFARLRPDVGLYGRSHSEAGEVDSWVDFVSREIEVPMMAWVNAKKGNNQAVISQAQGDLKNALKVVDTLLLRKTFLVGERMTLADVCLTVVLSHGNDNAFEANWLKDNFVNLHRLYLTVAHHPVVGKVTPRQCPGGVCGQKKEQNVCKKPQQQQKAAEPKEKKQTAEEIEQQLEKEAKAKAKNNPLDQLPPTKLNLDEWKRVYSNTKDLKGEAMPWFWEHFDPEGWSFWYMKYDKLEGECEKDFTTCNQLRGFLQRLEPAFRKYSFAVNNVIGVEGNYDIQGVWMIRGHELPSFLLEHPSIDYHKMTKLDHNKPEEKKLIEDYWVEEDMVEGRPIKSCNVWK